jgi:hypothetical protein
VAARAFLLPAVIAAPLSVLFSAAMRCGLDRRYGTARRQSAPRCNSARRSARFLLKEILTMIVVDIPLKLTAASSCAGIVQNGQGLFAKNCMSELNSES